MGLYRCGRALPAAITCALLAACGHVPPQSGVGALRLLGERIVANDLRVEGTLVGGLSGIDYDAASNVWYLISDDRSDHQPARFYTANLAYGLGGFTSVEVRSVVTLRSADGSPYPNRKAGGQVVDPEAIRLDPLNPGVLWWNSEGDRTLGLDPFVAQVGLDGRLRATLPLPERFRMHPSEPKGPRNNTTFEGLAFSEDGRSVWVAMEGPLHEDGPPATPSKGAVSRITKYDRSGNVLAEYAYPLDPLHAEPVAGKYADNGVTEILAINERELLVVERAAVQGADDVLRISVRIYEAQTEGASDVAALPALASGNHTPVKKRLVLDLATLGLAKIDNIEGVSWGPVLANGRRSLVLVSDNNFNPAGQITQFLAFEVLPK